jgi:gas vesicle protein
MEEERERQVFSFVSGLLLGAIIGAGVALLTAPESGHRTRKRLKRAATGLKDSAAHRLDDIAEEVKGKVDEVIKSARTRYVS